jgi:hypothetical protein
MSNTPDKMTSAERTELHKVLCRREKEARETVDEVKARRLADFETELATIFDHEHEAFADVTTLAKELVAKADAEIQRRCDELGIRLEFRPDLRLGWSGRGANTSRERRVELRRVAQTRAESDARATKTKITRAFTDQMEALAVGALTSDEARAFLEGMPRPEVLMPEVRLAELDVAGATYAPKYGDPFPLFALGQGDEPTAELDEDDEAEFDEEV